MIRGGAAQAGPHPAVISNEETFGDVKVRVFDRYGAVVFQETAYENTWLGRIRRGTRGNGILPDGT